MKSVLKCPMCQQEMNPEYKPFCSKRCANIDLARWFRGDYKIEGDEEAFVEETSVEENNKE